MLIGPIVSGVRTHSSWDMHTLSEVQVMDALSSLLHGSERERETPSHSVPRVCDVRSLERTTNVKS